MLYVFYFSNLEFQYGFLILNKESKKNRAIIVIIHKKKYIYKEVL